MNAGSLALAIDVSALHQGVTKMHGEGRSGAFAQIAERRVDAASLFIRILFGGFVAILLLAHAARAGTLSAGLTHTCAVTGSGGVKCWGENSIYGLGDGTLDPHAIAVDVLGLGERIKDVSASAFYSCALTTRGAVKCWGYGLNGQLGIGVETIAPHPVQVSGLNADVRALVAGPRHACALTRERAVLCWGNNEFGELGDGTENNSALPVRVVGLESGVLAIGAGDYYTCALTAAHGVKCWGRNDSGQLGDGTKTKRAAPVGVVGLRSGVTAISLGTGHACALMLAGQIKCWGGNGSGALGNGTTQSSSVPVDANTVKETIVEVAAGDSHTCALTQAGAVQCWGYNRFGALGDGTAKDSASAVDVFGLQSGVVAIAGSGRHTCARLKTGELRCWGDGSREQLGNGILTASQVPVDVIGLHGAATSIATTESQSCAVLAGGSAACWGQNFVGELGDGTTMPHASATAVRLADSSFLSIVTGASHSCGISREKKVLCWGMGIWGISPAPVALALEGDATMLAAGASHDCALTASGEVYCWGNNSVGQLGFGADFPLPDVPHRVKGLDSGAKAIASGGFHSCALTTEGGVKCWGQNARAELGDGTTANRNRPVDVLGLESGVVGLSAFETQTCALMESGSVICWGEYRNGLEEVTGFGGKPVMIAAGALHVCALMAAGNLKCAGRNEHGQLGDGTLEYRPTAVDVAGTLSGATWVAAGRFGTCAVVAGVSKCWGDNDYGQLGNGEAGFALAPVKVIGSPFTAPRLRLPPQLRAEPEPRGPTVSQ